LGRYYIDISIKDIKKEEQCIDKLSEFNINEISEMEYKYSNYKIRKFGKEKWYFISTFLKIYNFDFLNKPNSITFDLAFFPLLIYTTFQIGINKEKTFQISLNFEFNENTPKFNFKFNLFSYFLKLELGENTIVRKANQKRIKDFQTLKKYLTNPYKTLYFKNILQLQIIRKNITFIKYLLENIELEKFPSTDLILIEAAYKENYNEEIFNLLINKINRFNNWAEIDRMAGAFSIDAIQKLCLISSENQK
jgi:hypothetical protein